MAISNIQTIDLAHIRETFPSPTCDVKFTFEDKNSGVKSELPAHKLVLALGCDVFMAQFYGPHKEERDTIPVEDSSVDAFKLLLELLYNKKVAFKNLGFKLLAELFYLADKFILDNLKDIIILEVSSMKIVSEKLLEAAQVAEDQAHLERFSEALYKVCVKFVRKNIESVFEIFDREDPGVDSSFTLHRLMAKAKKEKQQQTEENKEDWGTLIFGKYGEKVTEQGTPKSKQAKPEENKTEEAEMGSIGYTGQQRGRGTCPKCRKKIEWSMMEYHAAGCRPSSRKSCDDQVQEFASPAAPNRLSSGSGMCPMCRREFNFSLLVKHAALCDG